MSFKDLSEWFRKLREASETYPVLVEGRRDAQALKRFGVRNVITLSGKRFADVADLLEERAEGVFCSAISIPRGRESAPE